MSDPLGRVAARPRCGARRRWAFAATACVVSAIGALASLSACGVFPPPNLEPPKVAFAGLSIDEIGAQRVRFTVRIEAHNPNPVDIPLTDVRFALAVFGEPLANGVVAERRVILPAKGSREVPIQFDVATADVGAVLRRAAAGPWPDGVWELKGSAQWGDTGLAIPFQRRGDSESLRRLRDLLRR
jgi:LEA14-like dessication related protein